VNLAIPVFALFDQGYERWTYAISTRYCRLGYSPQLNHSKNVFCVTRRQLGIARNVARHVIACVSESLFVLKVIDLVVLLPFVLVVNIMIGWSRPNKGFGNNGVDHSGCVAALAMEQADHQIAASVYARGKNLFFLVFGCVGAPSVFVSNKSVNAADAAHAADLINTFVSRYVAPFFSGMIGVHRNLSFRCQAQDVCRVAGHFLLANYSFILPQASR
jgi:hypothetical protein